MLKIIAPRFGLYLAWLAALLLAGCASTGTHDDAQASVKAAEKTLANFQRDPEMKWLHENIRHAKAVLVSPDILQAGFIVGGAGGSAVVLARGKGGREWDGPAFYKIATGNIGLQAGAQSSEMVALIMSENALNSLLSTSFKLGGDISVAAGPMGRGAAAPVQADMVTFTRSKGLYGGLNLDGTVISIDEGGNRAFYGRPATPVDILVKHSVSSSEGARLAKIASMPGGASSGSSAAASGSAGGSNSSGYSWPAGDN
jgi:lipid-binding SYLF domain-containing protein